ncbi:hypothetical protein GCM10012285_55220 [Streptomyces kronopolitis]|uniref:Uncharacterized protein n=1 Tax=Streptomyces kronopolitis TaxID=1612435 RepID=A0ABQ2JXV6_9ACTN|nr:hypothetical protein GCM10012285_55220 [Streptomyces kronopolitis]
MWTGTPQTVLEPRRAGITEYEAGFRPVPVNCGSQASDSECADELIMDALHKVSQALSCTHLHPGQLTLIPRSGHSFACSYMALIFRDAFRNE